MRDECLSSLVLCLSVVANSPGVARADQPDEGSLREREQHVVRLIALLEQELVQIRSQLAAHPPRRGVTPQEAVEQFKKSPKTPVTVEFGVEPIGYPDVLRRPDDDPEPPIWATWDNRLLGGGSLLAIIPPEVYRRLMLPTADGEPLALTPGQERSQVVKHIEANGIRVTGILEPTGFQDQDYVIRITDPAKVVLYIKGSGK